MGTQILEFVSAHGTVVVIAVTLLATIGIVQWRKARVAELDAVLLENLLAQGLAVEEIETLLHAKATPRSGMVKQLGKLIDDALKQFGALSDAARWVLMSPFLMAVMCTFAFIPLLLTDNQMPEPHASRPQANQPPASHDFQANGFALTPERLIVFLGEAGAGNCRVYLTDNHAVHDFQMVAAVSAQDNSESELRVETTPIAVLQAEGGGGQRYCDVRLQAVRGAGQFTVQLTAIYEYRRQAQTTFSVQIGPSQPMASPSDRGDDAPSDGWL